MDKIFKVYSTQSENISNSNNLLDFELPAGNMFDLSKSHVMINANASASGGAAGSVSNVEGRMDIGGGNFGFYVPSVGLVKNARLHSESKGRIEELRDVNLLRIDQKVRAETEAQKLGHSISNMTSVTTEEQWGHMSPLIDVSAESGVSARYINKQIKIPLKDILNIGKVQQFDTQRLGKCRLSLEVAHDLFAARAVVNQPAYFAAGNQKNGVCLNKTTSATNQTLTLGLVATPKVYDEDYQEHIPWYIGLAVKVVTDEVGGAGQVKVITDITQDQTAAATKGAVTLTFDSAFTNAAMTNPIVTPVEQANGDCSVVLGQAELRLYAVGSNNNVDAPDTINYTTWTLERDGNQGALVQNFKKQYQFESQTQNMHVCMKSQAGGLFSDINNMTDYRVTIDNEPTTNRDVNSTGGGRTPLYYHQEDRANLNSGGMLKDLSEKDIVTAFANVNNGNISEKKHIVEPLPVSNQMKLVELEINFSSDGLGEINIYKESPRSI